VCLFSFLATQFWRNKVLEVAKDHRDITFAIANEEDFQDKLKDLGLDDSGEEISVGCFEEKGRRYRMEPDEEFSEDSFREFVEEFKAG
jgi:protein disulfide-isomerase A4